MKKILSLVLSIAFLFQFSLLTACAQTETKVKTKQTVTVKTGTSIPVIALVPKNSKQISSGEKIEAVIDSDIKVGETLVFKKGDRASLIVVQAKKAGFVGIPGEIVIAGAEVYDTNNDAHRVEAYQTFIGEEKTWPKVMMGISIFLLFPLALFGFVKGGQAEVKPYIPINTRTTQDFEFIINNL
ncbi:MAG: hypothetical protein E7Z87_01660 [Cyanobacteria bacterium SIG26]|nr:hypothetical protein [Cyanobacteria bacterium SIG26]